MSLVRLRQNQGETFAAELPKAWECLREVYGRFTRRFALPALQETAALTGGWGRGTPRSFVYAIENPSGLHLRFYTDVEAR